MKKMIMLASLLATVSALAGCMGHDYQNGYYSGGGHHVRHYQSNETSGYNRDYQSGGYSTSINGGPSASGYSASQSKQVGHTFSTQGNVARRSH